MKYPNGKEEKKLWRKGYKFVAGLDEAGVGSLAGPVVAGIVCLKENAKLKIKNLKDSKKLTPLVREKIFNLIKKNRDFLNWGIGKVSEKIIDKINVKKATELAMTKALKNLEKKLKKRIDFLIIDGKNIKNKTLRSYQRKSIIKGDQKVFSCALASILAKVTRDRVMLRYHKIYSRYRFDLHKGYPTKLHLRLLKKYGPCKIHRKSFFPVSSYLK